jgi:hypothetical protein
MAGTLVVASTQSQTHTRTPLVLGQEAVFAVDNATPGDLCAILIGFGGVGNGFCFGSPHNFCLDLLDPWELFVFTTVDGAGRVERALTVPAVLPLIAVHSQALVADPSVVTVAKTNVVSGSIEPMNALSDEFDGSTLSSDWQILHGDQFQYSVSGGELHMEATVGGSNAAWFADGEGPLIYKLVRGDFSVRATVRVYDSTQPTQPPPPQFRFGGLSVRDPLAPPGGHNWLHVVVGAGRSSSPIAVEDKSTTNSSSSLVLTAISETRGEVRADREGSLISFFYRAPGEQTWQALRSFNRPDLPQVVQVGLNVQSFSSPPRVAASFSAIIFQ